MGGSMYVLAGGKGGVGRTTTALDTGIALERAGYDTVLVDGDVAMADLTELLDADPAGGVRDVLAGRASINDAVVDGPEGLTVVAGNRSPAACDGVDERKLGRIVEPLAAAHDVVLVDTPPGLDPLHRDAYERADGTVLVTTPGVGAVASAERTARVVEEVGGSVLGAVVTMAEEGEARETVADLDADPLAVVPEDPALVRKALVEDGPAADAFERLAAAIGAHADGEAVGAADPDDESAAGTTAQAGEAASGAGPGDDGAASATSDDPLDRLFADEYAATGESDAGLTVRFEAFTARFTGADGTE